MLHKLTNHRSFALFSAIPAIALTGLVACGGDEDDGGPDAQTASFTVTVENISNAFSYLQSGAQNTPVDAGAPGPILPGEAYEFEFYAGPGHNLSLALMFVQSNDFFYAPHEQGIPLFEEDGTPVSGDVTDYLLLWDAGTEADQEPGLGADQAPRQAGPNTGDPDPDNTVRLAEDTYGNLPIIDEVLSATLTPGPGNHFTMRIENLSNDQTLATSDGGSTAIPLAPVAYVLHTEEAPLFSAGEADRGMGLGTLAEDGDPGELVASLAPATGLATPFAPGVYAVHQPGDILFVSGEVDVGLGLEALAEDGDPSALAGSLASDEMVAVSGVFNTPDGAASPGPALPGGSYSFTFEASAGQNLSLATMLVQSNDFFFAPQSAGIPLFDADGDPITGDITSDIRLWNAGTEVEQVPGAGPDQAPRQAGPNTGDDEGGPVAEVADGNWPSPDQLIRVTVTVAVP